ncbi:phosphoglycolate phosphatase [Fulvimarina endophytica]|nr:phosphoglycolate phosphatase [Fulvimarina endophytica]
MTTYRPRAVLFDLDGTLIDSIPDIQEALNDALAERDIDPFDRASVRVMVGGGTGILLERALLRRGVSIEDTERDRLVSRFLEFYEPRASRLTTLLPGAPEALAACRRRGMKVGLVTNKPAAPSRSILEAFGLLADFDLIVGGDAGPAKKPNPDLLLHAAERLDLSAGSCLFVGDSENDVEAARGADMPVAAVENGYTQLSMDEMAPTYRLASLHDLDALLEALPQV